MVNTPQSIQPQSSATAAAAHSGGLLAGELVGGRYQVGHTIGEGGFCTVYAAEHTGTGQAVALKVLSRRVESPDARERFLREARVTASLRHPNTVRVFDVGETAWGGLYLAMEMLRGPTLAVELQRRKKRGAVMGEAETIDLAVSVLGSLDEAHRAGLVHRDLKPSNLVLCSAEDIGDRADPARQLHPKVLDFGIARTADSQLTEDKQTLGTPSYMSPEQCLAQPVDLRSDLYSLAVVLWECVCGTLPFADTNPMTVMFGHAYHDLPDLQAATKVPLSAEFVRCLTCALSKHPSERFATAAEMRLVLLSIVTAEAPGTVEPEGLKQTPSPRMKAHRATPAATHVAQEAQRQLDELDEIDDSRGQRILLVGVLISVLGIVIFLIGQVV